ncbi:MAG: c-type cytochrome domain-containing protein, partial [Planctomycetota bacterium]
MPFTLTPPLQPPATRLFGDWQWLLVAGLLCGGAVGRGETVAPPVTPAAEAQFEAQVRPLLVSRCQGCHGASKAESGLRLDSRASLLKGDDAGSIVSVGDPAASRLLTAIHRSGDSPMPPDEPLPAE